MWAFLIWKLFRHLDKSLRFDCFERKLWSSSLAETEICLCFSPGGFEGHFHLIGPSTGIYPCYRSFLNESQPRSQTVGRLPLGLGGIYMQSIGQEAHLSSLLGRPVGLLIRCSSASYVENGMPPLATTCPSENGPLHPTCTVSE